MAFNRRLRMKGGHTYTHPGLGNPEVVDYAGPTDPEVGVLGAWNEEGKLAAPNNGRSLSSKANADPLKLPLFPIPRGEETG